MVNFNLVTVLLIGAFQVGAAILLATEKESHADVHPIATLMRLLHSKPKNLTFDLPVWNGFVMDYAASNEPDYSDSNEPNSSDYDESYYSDYKPDSVSNEQDAATDEADSVSNEPDSATDEPYSATDKPDSAADEAASVSNEPDSATD
ncbi:uncharacterized protein LOC119072221 [Bradysia coprophila]|uniref:uncharacterized protein LOC119072221 n=1 Tax=Bradysia coprophila TaxID=38358 RepID=UPI00187DAAE2|nr:uncharacterized protein LOC119072221 [Bradysia coprophila]